MKLHSLKKLCKYKHIINMGCTTHATFQSTKQHNTLYKLIWITTANCSTHSCLGRKWNDSTQLSAVLDIPSAAVETISVSVAAHTTFNCTIPFLPLHQCSTDPAKSQLTELHQQKNHCYKKKRVFCCFSSMNWLSAGSEECKCQHKRMS